MVDFTWKPAEKPPTEIKWIAAELPINTVIEDSVEGAMIKSSENCWEVIGADNPYNYVRDEEISEFKIIAVPPSWYEEFRVVPGQTVREVNRAGHVRRSGAPVVESTLTLVYMGNDSFLYIPEAVRRAFNAEY